MVLCLAFLLKQAAIENLQDCVFLLQMLLGSWGNCCVSAHNMCQCKVMLFLLFFSLKWYLGCHFLKLVPCMINEHVLFRTLECTWETWAVLLTFSVNLNKCFLSLSLFLPGGLKPNKCHQWLLLAVDLWTCLSMCHDTRGGHILPCSSIGAGYLSYYINWLIFKEWFTPSQNSCIKKVLEVNHSPDLPVLSLLRVVEAWMVNETRHLFFKEVHL